MKVNPSIFKSYDIRGIYPKELNKETAFKVGQAFVNYIKAKKIAVGRDMRLSSPVVFESLTKGIISQGADVYEVGLVPTECLYFSVVNYKYDAGVMVTASHNPKEYNGFKLIKRKGNKVQFIRGEDMLKVVKKDFPIRKKGKIKKIDIWPKYISHIFSFVNIKKIKPLKVVIDAGNGMAGKVIPLIYRKLPIELVALNFNLDGGFPSRPSNVFEPGALNQIKMEIKKQKADLGFLFDGDADRIYLIDEKGNFIRADISLLLLAKYFLKKNPKGKIVYNLICSKVVPEFIKKWGGQAIRSPVGAVNIMNLVSKNKAIMGGEVSGHYCFKDSFSSDSGFISFLIFLEIISELNKKLSEVVKELSLYAKGDEINFRVKSKKKIIDLVRKVYPDGKQDYLDGVTVEYNDWWFNLRPSNTEPLMRLTIEADNEKLLRQKTKELKSLVLEK